MPNGLPFAPADLIIKPVTLWGIHGGQFAEVEELFLTENVIALGWSEVGNLNEYPSRDRLTRALSKIYRGNSLRSIGMKVSELYRFRTELQYGDVMVLV